MTGLARDTLREVKLVGELDPRCWEGHGRGMHQRLMGLTQCDSFRKLGHVTGMTSRTGRRWIGLDVLDVMAIEAGLLNGKIDV